MWICPEFQETLEVLPLRDPQRTLWKIHISFQKENVLVRGRPIDGKPDFLVLDASVSLWPVAEIELLPDQLLPPLRYYEFFDSL